MNRFMRSVLSRRRHTGRSSLPRPLALVALLVALALTAIGGPAGARAQEPGVGFNFDLINSEIVASRGTLAAGEDLTLTVIVRNDGGADSIDVTVQYPPELAYVAGSAAGGTHSAADRAISWENIPVAGGGEARRTLKVRTTGAVAAEKSVQIYAAIAGQQEHIIRWTSVRLVTGGTQPPPAQADLSGSSKRADRSELGPGAQLRYTITLRNTGGADATATVSDPLPAELSFVAGSITGGGSYDPAQRRVRWEGVAVGAGETVDLAFKVTAPASIAAAKNVVNTATIQAGGASLTRSATVRLVPAPAPNPDPEPNPGAARLTASLKLASRVIARPDDTIEYRIVLYNNGTADGVVSVRDPLPSQLSYVAGSATGGGSYDEGSRTLTWRNITVRMGRQVTLTYEARPAAAPTSPRTVVNTAEISVGGTTIRRSFPVVLIPGAVSPGADAIAPTVAGVTIGNADVLTSPDTTVKIVASDNVGVEEIYLREWQLVTGRGIPHWRVVRSSGWIDYQSEVAWKLGGEPGTHYVGVWARDAAGNVSTLGPLAIDFASLLVPGAEVARARADIYQVYYPAGVSVRATVRSGSGDADLYVWHPGNMLRPDGASTADGSADDSVSFTTPRAGTYLFVVVGYTSATYDLSISAPGGPRLAAEASLADTAAAADTAAEPEAAPAATRPAPAVATLFGSAGLDPLGNVSAATADLTTVHMPVIVR